MTIKIYKNLKTELPVMIAGWPGMGHVGLMAVEYARRKLNAKRLAVLDISRYRVPESVEVKDGLAALPGRILCNFYYTEDPPVLFFEGESQVAGPASAEIISEVLDFAARLGVRRIFTGAAFASNLSSREPSAIYAAANKRNLLKLLVRHGARMMPEGQITGMNGTLIGFAGMRNIEAACLMSTMPVYAVSIPNPKASYALVEIFEKILSFNIDKKELAGQSRIMEENMVVIEEKIREIFPVVLSEKEKESISIEEDHIPAYIIDKIERLFEAASRDRRKAEILKKELDRWNLYPHYEDRFLGLFRENS